MFLTLKVNWKRREIFHIPANKLHAWTFGLYLEEQRSMKSQSEMQKTQESLSDSLEKQLRGQNDPSLLSKVSIGCTLHVWPTFLPKWQSCIIMWWSCSRHSSYKDTVTTGWMNSIRLGGKIQCLHCTHTLIKSSAYRELNVHTEEANLSDLHAITANGQKQTWAFTSQQVPWLQVTFQSAHPEWCLSVWSFEQRIWPHPTLFGGLGSFLLLAAFCLRGRHVYKVSPGLNSLCTAL